MLRMKSIVYIGTSLDGFIARTNGDIEWLVQFANDEAIRAYESFISKVQAIVIGRGTFEKVLSFPTWPYDKEVFVLSNSLKSVPDQAKGKVSLLSMKPVEVLRYLSDKGYSTIYIDGGKVIQDFLREDLVDELIVSKVPILIGSGIPLFGELKNDLHFQHIRTEIQANELVRSYYVRKRQFSVTS